MKANRKFRISSRDLLWLTLVVGLTIAWYLERSKAELWRARADYVRRIVRDLGWESDWKGPTATFDQVSPPPAGNAPAPADESPPDAKPDKINPP